MMFLSKEMSDKDRSLKTQLIVSSNSDNEKISGERVWKNDGFFKDLRPDLNIEKVNMPENMLYYVNQSFLSTVKNDDIAMYNHNFILGQMLVVANQPADISSYVCKKNKVKLYCCIYDLSNGQSQGVKEQLAYIILRGDTNEIFFSYSYDSSKTKVLYSFLKHQIPDALFRLHLRNILMKS